MERLINMGDIEYKNIDKSMTPLGFDKDDNLLVIINHKVYMLKSYNDTINSTLVNDTLYGGDSYGDLTLGLVCKTISFIHPITKETINLKSKYE
jgi:Ca2+-binding RTX toxin-like protein